MIAHDLDEIQHFDRAREFESNYLSVFTVMYACRAAQPRQSEDEGG